MSNRRWCWRPRSDQVPAENFRESEFVLSRVIDGDIECSDRKYETSTHLPTPLPLVPLPIPLPPLAVPAVPPLPPRAIPLPPLPLVAVPRPGVPVCLELVAEGGAEYLLAGLLLVGGFSTNDVSVVRKVASGSAVLRSRNGESCN